MAAKLTRLTHKTAIQLHLVAKSCTICNSRSRRPVRKVLDTPAYEMHAWTTLRVSVHTASLVTGVGVDAAGFRVSDGDLMSGCFGT